MSRKKVSYPGFVCKVSALLYQIFRLELAGIPNDVDWMKRSVERSDLDGKGVGHLHDVEFHWPGLHLKAEVYVWADRSVTLVAVTVELRCGWNGRASDRNMADFGQLLRLIRRDALDSIGTDGVIYHGASSNKVRSRYPLESKPPRMIELNIPEQRLHNAIGMCSWPLDDDWRF